MKMRLVLSVVIAICFSQCVIAKNFPGQLLSGKEWKLLSPTVRVINQGWIVGDSTITVFYESKKDGERFVFSTSPLQGKDWVVKSPPIDSIKRGWIFNDTIMTRYIELSDGKRADIEVQYYLSDTKDETFDKKKVGTTAQGKYIIANRKQMVGEIPTAQYTTEQFEIVSLSPDELVVISPLGTKAVLKASE